MLKKPVDPKQVEKYLIPSVSRTIDVLEFMASQDGDGLTLSELHRQLNIPMGTLYKILATLELHDYINKGPDGLYRLANGLFYLVIRQTAQFDLRRAALPIMRRLAELTQETVECGILSRSHWGLLVVEKVDSVQPIQLLADVGVMLRLHTVAGGKVLLAHEPEGEVERFLREKGLFRDTARTIIDPHRFREYLREVRETGYAIDYGEARAEVARVAAPICDRSGRVIAALGIAGPTFRLNRARLRELATVVVELANQV